MISEVIPPGGDDEGNLGVLGLEVLQARAAEASFPFLSANLVNPETQALFFAPYTVIEREGVSIGVIGISDEEVVQVPKMARWRPIWMPLRRRAVC